MSTPTRQNFHQEEGARSHAFFERRKSRRTCNHRRHPCCQPVFENLSPLPLYFVLLSSVHANHASCTQAECALLGGDLFAASFVFWVSLFCTRFPLFSLCLATKRRCSTTTLFFLFVKQSNAPPFNTHRQRPRSCSLFVFSATSFVPLLLFLLANAWLVHLRA